MNKTRVSAIHMFANPKLKLLCALLRPDCLNDKMILISVVLEEPWAEEGSLCTNHGFGVFDIPAAWPCKPGCVSLQRLLRMDIVIL